MDLIYPMVFRITKNTCDEAVTPRILYGNWDWIKNFLSHVPKVDSKIVQLDLLGVAVDFFSLIS